MSSNAPSSGVERARDLEIAFLLHVAGQRSGSLQAGLKPRAINQTLINLR